MDRPEYINIFSDYARDVVKIKINEYNKQNNKHFTGNDIIYIHTVIGYITIFFSYEDHITINIKHFKRK